MVYSPFAQIAVDAMPVQMLENNLETSGKLLELADGLVDADDALVGKLISKSLADVVASFDGFGRAICETYASKSSNPSQAEKNPIPEFDWGAKQYTEVLWI